MPGRRRLLEQCCERLDAHISGRTRLSQARVRDFALYLVCGIGAVLIQVIAGIAGRPAARSSAGRQVESSPTRESGFLMGFLQTHTDSGVCGGGVHVCAAADLCLDHCDRVHDRLRLCQPVVSRLLRMCGRAVLCRAMWLQAGAA